MIMEKFYSHFLMSITNFHIINYEKLKCKKLKYLFTPFLAKALLLLLRGIEPMEESLREGNKNASFFMGYFLY